MFTRASKPQIPSKIKMNNIEIEYSDSTKYLGVHIDSKLLWSTHFDKIAAKAKQYLMQLMGSLSKKWGPKPNIITGSARYSSAQ